ncbi:MAG: DUF6049 family protein [Haloechinothrix sp.]
MNRRLLACGLAAFFTFVQALIAAPAHAEQPIAPETSRLALDVASVTPRMVDSSTETLTVTGEITNTGDRPIADIRARLQLGIRQSTSDQVAQALSGEARTDAQLSPFELVIDELAPGESRQLTIEAGLLGGAGNFVLTEPGVYPLLVNINGQPAYSGTARLASLNMLLPVLETPGGSDDSTESPGNPGPEESETPTPVSILWPIATTPSVVSAPLDGTLVLANDRLADAMRPQGRLDALVSAAESARGNPRLFSALCFAIDPEVVETAQAMTSGYRVRTEQGTVEGSGAAAARRWLDKLRELVAGRCVVALPYAGADVTALGNISPELTQAAIAHDDVLARVLEVRPRTSAFWHPGALTDAVLAALTDAGRSVLITDPGRLKSDTPINRPVDVLTADGEPSEQRLVPTDPLVSQGFGSVPPPSDNGYVGTSASQVPALATRDGIAALVFRTRFDDTAAGAPVLIAPPRRWDAQADELAGMLRTLADLTTQRVITPTPVADLLEAKSTGSAPAAVCAALTARLPNTVVDDITDVEATLADLRAAMSEDPAKQVEPGQVLRPVRNGLLRAASTAWRHDPDIAEIAGDHARDQLDDLLGAVQVTEPGRTISLASGAAPLPVLITNELPVAITVRIRLLNTVGLRPEPVGDLNVPANGSVTRHVPAEALRAGVFNVNVGLTTPGGTELGTPAQFRLASTQYGLITVIVTATAAGALLLLSGRRIYRRVRASKAARD